MINLVFYSWDQEGKKGKRKTKGSETGSIPGGLATAVITLGSPPSKGRHQKEPATIAKRDTGEMNVLKSITWPVLNVLKWDIRGETAPLVGEPEVQNPFCHHHPH